METQAKTIDKIMKNNQPQGQINEPPRPNHRQNNHATRAKAVDNTMKNPIRNHGQTNENKPNPQTKGWLFCLWFGLGCSLFYLWGWSFIVLSIMPKPSANLWNKQAKSIDKGMLVLSMVWTWLFIVLSVGLVVHCVVYCAEAMGKPLETSQINRQRADCFVYGLDLVVHCFTSGVVLSLCCLLCRNCRQTTETSHIHRQTDDKIF